MRAGKDTVKQASDLIDSMRKAKVKRFGIWKFGLQDRKDLENLVRLAKEYHKIQEHDCNGTKTERMNAREINIETEIRAMVAKYGLKVHFDGDPRGYCVKLHAPQGNVWNTLGGRETGYGIG